MKRPAVAGSRTQDTSGLSCQCSATKLQQQPSLGPVAVAQWQSTGSSSQKCPEFDSQRLPAFSLSSICGMRQDALSMRFTVYMLSYLLNWLLGVLYEAATLDFELARR